MSSAAAIHLDLGSNLDDPPKEPFVKPAALPERVKIYLEESEDIPPTGLFVGVNGVSYMLRPGMDMSVPRGVLDVLNNAVTSVPVIDPISRKTLGYRSKRRYSYRLV